jgi:hypothetical protein
VSLITATGDIREPGGGYRSLDDATNVRLNVRLATLAPSSSSSPAPADSPRARSELAQGVHPRRPELVAIHSWFVEDVRDALDDDERAFLALSPLGGQAPLPVTNVVVRDPDGSHELAVDRCGYTEILMETFGERCDAVMHQLVVETSPRCLRALLDAVQY